MSNKSLLKEAFRVVLEDINAGEEQIKRYFHPDYYQWVDGHELNFDGFVQHMKAQKKRIKRLSINFESLIEDGDKLATIHHVDATTIDEHPVKGMVIAHFTVKDNRLIRCVELTNISHGREEDKDLGHTVD